MGRRRAEPFHVALILETSMAYGRNILRGVARYLAGHGPWTVYLEQRSLQDPAPRWLAGWQGDGILMCLPPRATRMVQGLGIPAVDLNDQRPVAGGPHVQSDHEAIGALAAGHLLERGFAHFAFFGYPEFAWSRQAFAGFSKAVGEAGFVCQEYRRARRVSWGHQQASWGEEVEGVARWIGSLPKPLGLMAGNDFRGLQVLDACRRAGVAVPEEVAVIGVDNETVACELAYPPLSSVIPDCLRIGYEAAALLDRMMRGGPPPPGRGLRIPPLGVATRQSTDVVAIADARVASALRFIREHCCERIGVRDVLEHVHSSRSVLQRRFRALLGRTIHDVLAECRIRRVKQLLVETDLTLPAIADRTGFTHPEYLSVAFHRAVGTTPGAYRRSHRGASGGVEGGPAGSAGGLAGRPGWGEAPAPPLGPAPLNGR